MVVQEWLQQRGSPHAPAPSNRTPGTPLPHSRGMPAPSAYNNYLDFEAANGAISHPSRSIDIMEQSTEVADTFYSEAGAQDLLDTDVFLQV
jgi:hypothetical protein